ncbi:MAG: hypothetical protein A2104_03510 [Candidatus Melainabacteria bacterium GWF2_32_7]|nr:MAG: hypothetical protein A2104_03510 [Candidatus Melainabacteria bacterium GWF2_32_7]
MNTKAILGIVGGVAGTVGLSYAKGKAKGFQEGVKLAVDTYENNFSTFESKDFISRPSLTFACLKSLKELSDKGFNITTSLKI